MQNENYCKSDIVYYYFADDVFLFISEKETNQYIVHFLSMSRMI